MNAEELKTIKVDIKDSEALRKIPPNNVRDYLISIGWEKTVENEKATWWEHKKFQKHQYAIILPKSKELLDYSRRMQDCLEMLEQQTGHTQLELYEILVEGKKL